MKYFVYFHAIVTLVLLGGLTKSHAGEDGTLSTRSAQSGSNYGRNPPYDQFESVIPHGLEDNKWLSTLHEGCPEAQQQGWIRVGSPQIYSRQLVYRDRAEEIQFLSDRLKATREFHLKYQGVMDARFYSALAQQLAVEFDPASGKVLDQQQHNLLASTQQQGALTSMQNEINLLNLRQQLVIATNTLADIQNKGTKIDAPASTIPSAAGTPADPATAQQISNLQGQIQSLQQQINTLNTPVVAPINNLVQPVLADGTKKPVSAVLATGGSAAATADKAGLTGIEEEKSILEVRRFLQNERRRLSFDDMHDASGSIVLELGMLVTLVPPKDKDAYALLEISVEKPDDHDDQNYNYDLLLMRWADHLAPAIQAESDLISLRYNNGMFPPNEKFMQIAAAQAAKEGNNQTTNDGKIKIANSGMPSITRLNSALRAASDLPSIPNVNKITNSTTLSAALREFTTSSSQNQGQINSFEVNSNTASHAAERATLSPEVLKRYLSLYYGADFIDAFEEYEKTQTLSSDLKKMCFRFLNWTDKGVKVLAVDPAEQAQNISMVGATQNVRSLVLSLNAMLGSGVKGSARNDYYRDSELYMQSVNRKPLAVGFVNGAAIRPSFGWILGPRYQVALKRRWYQLGFLGEPRPTPTFSHEPTTHQVQVVVSLPTWIPRLMLKVKAHWIDKRTGLPVKPLNTPHVFVDDYPLPSPASLRNPLNHVRTSSDCAARIPVNLEPDFSALTEGLLDYVHGKRRPPRIFLQDANERFILSTSTNSSGTSHHLVLLGKDLWRTPSVYLDSLPASSVEVMPGLVGVVATFDSLPPSDDKYYNVTVSTTGGFDSIPNIVMAPGNSQGSNPVDANAGATPVLSLTTRQVIHDYTAAISDANPVNLFLKIAKNPYPLISPDKYLEASVGIAGLIPTASASLVPAADNALVAKVTGAALSSQLAGIVPPGSSPNAVKIICNTTMKIPAPDAMNSDMLLKNVITGSREVILFKNADAKKFVISPTTATAGEYNVATDHLITIALPEGVPVGYFNFAFPEYGTALNSADLRLRLTGGNAQQLDLVPNNANSLTFQLPSLEKVSSYYGLKKGNLKVTLTGHLIVPNTPPGSFPLKTNVSLSIPEPPQ